jgi:membrane protease subunit (stomatin/prohibitin family)
MTNMGVGLGMMAGVGGAVGSKVGGMVENAINQPPKPIISNDTTACPECNNALPANAKFCLECGASIAKKCPNCNTDIPPNGKFCPKCGQKL